MMKKILLIALLSLGSGVFAQESKLSLDINLAYFFPSLEGYGSTGFFSGPGYPTVDNPSPTATQFKSMGGSVGAPGVEGVLNYSYTLPFLTGSGVLFEGNNLSINTWASMTPVSFFGAGQIILTPLALLKFRAGIGAGWGWSPLGLKGLGVNSDGEKAPDSFKGRLIQGWGAGTFQFDFGAVFPGDWNHVVTVVDLNLQAQQYSDADSKTPWFWKADFGENFNGLKLIGTYFLGYQLPEGMPVSLLGILTSSEAYLGDAANLSPMSSGFGSDFIYWTSGPMVNLKFSDFSSLVILIQVQDRRKYTPSTAFEKLFTNRTYEGSVVEFNRFVLSWTQKL